MQKASGFITLTNMTSSEHDIPVGLVVESLPPDPVRFITTKTTQLPAGIGKKVTVPIETVLPGSNGNIEAGAIGAIEGEWGLFANVVNLEPIRGGTNILVPSPTQADYETARALLFQQFDRIAQTKVQSILEDSQIYIPGSLTTGQRFQEQILPGIGQPGEQLNLWIQQDYSGWYILDHDVSITLEPMLDALMPDEYMRSVESLTYEFSGLPLIGENSFEWQVIGKREIELEIFPEEIIRYLKAINARTAIKQFHARYPMENRSEIQLSPPWWPVMPFFSFQYEVLTP